MPWGCLGTTAALGARPVAAGTARDASHFAPAAASVSKLASLPLAGVMAPLAPAWNPAGVAKRTAPRRTGIVCTIGPRSEHMEPLEDVLKSGMTCMRMNFSHGQYDEQGARVDNLKAILKRRRAALGSQHATDELCAMAVDTKGPEVRTGMLVGGTKVQVLPKQTFLLHTAEAYREKGTAAGVFVDYPLHNNVQPGARVFLDDGLIELEVAEVQGTDVVCRALNGGLLGERKGVNCPGTSLDLPPFTEYDASVLRWGVSRGVDAVFASFIRSADDVRAMRTFLDDECAKVEGSRRVAIISKVEAEEALENIDEIIAESDGIMVARGDLAIEVPYDLVRCLGPAVPPPSFAALQLAEDDPTTFLHAVMRPIWRRRERKKHKLSPLSEAIWSAAAGMPALSMAGHPLTPFPFPPPPPLSDVVLQVPIAQKSIVAKCRLAGKPCIVATQMLDSMEKKPRPTRAEANDVVNAVLDGADCVMTSGETTNGEHPALVVRTMAQLCLRGEHAVETLADPHAPLKLPPRDGPLAELDVAALSAASAAPRGSMLVLPTTDAAFVRAVMRQRPPCDIVLCPTSSEAVANELLFISGATPLLVTSEEVSRDAPLAGNGKTFATLQRAATARWSSVESAGTAQLEHLAKVATEYAEANGFASAHVVWATPSHVVRVR